MLPPDLEAAGAEQTETPAMRKAGVSPVVGGVHHFTGLRLQNFG